MRVVLLTGASGSGKTTIANGVKTRRPGLAEALHFDGAGVPSAKPMEVGWGSGEHWQRAMTLEWMLHIADLGSQGHRVLFEGQTRLAFLREGLIAAGIASGVIILVDCDDATRARRLVHDRGQPELASPRMMNWAAYLRREAADTGCEVLDTSAMSLEEGVDHICLLLSRIGS